MNALKPLNHRQSSGDLGFEKLYAKRMNTAELMMTNVQSP